MKESEQDEDDDDVISKHWCISRIEAFVIPMDGSVQSDRKRGLQPPPPPNTLERIHHVDPDDRLKLLPILKYRAAARACEAAYSHRL